MIQLTQKEFLLLYKLLSNPDKIFTRIQLMDEIWGYECETGWETLTVHINRLRKKFEDKDISFAEATDTFNRLFDLILQ